MVNQKKAKSISWFLKRKQRASRGSSKQSKNRTSRGSSKVSGRKETGLERPIGGNRDAPQKNAKEKEDPIISPKWWRLKKSRRTNGLACVYL